LCSFPPSPLRYDTGTQTIVKDAAFSNWRAQPELGALAPAVWTGLVYGDQFKPEGMSVTRNVTYRGVDRDAILRYDVLPMGASRMFNWSERGQGRFSSVGWAVVEA
jgi:hypothetical protein